MSDDINAEIVEDEISVSVTNTALTRHSTRHEEGGSDEIDVNKLNISGDFDLETFDLLAGGQTVYDNTADEIPDSAMGSIANTTLTNDSVTLNANDGLVGGGTVALGGSLGLDIKPADFAGSFLTDDGSDNLQVDIGRGLEDDGTGTIQFDENTSYTFTVGQTFNAGLDTQADITDGTQVIWDESAQEVPDSALGSIDNATLTNDSVTLNANDGLVGGGTVALGGSLDLDIEPADFAGSFLTDDGSDNLQVDIGRGLEDDGTGAIQFDEDTSYTFTSAQSFSAGLETTGDITDGTTLIYDASLSQVEQDALENDSVTINANDGIVGGGTVALGSSVALDIEPADFAGSFLADDGADNLAVQIARGLEADGSGNIQFDEDTSYTFTSSQTFSAGLETTGDVTDGATLIYDSSLSQIEQDALENDSVTITAGDGLKNGGTVALGGATTVDVEPADFAGFALEDDGSDNLRVDEDASLTWTTEQTFNGGITAGANIDLQGTARVTNAPSPNDADELARKAYVDGVASGLDLKDSVDASPTTGIDLASTTDPNPVDGVTLADGDRVLLKNQMDATENGIYVAVTATDPSTWTRASDFDEDTEATNGAFTFVEDGTENGDSAFIVTSDDPITLGTTQILWSQFSSAGNISAGDGLTKSGQSLNIEPADFAGTFLSDNGSDDLQVDIGRGLENDGSGNVRFDEDTAYTFTSSQTFSAGLETTGDITDGTTRIYDSSLSQVEQDALENDSVTINANDGLKSGGTVSLGGSVGLDIEPADFAGTFISDDGSDNLTVDIARGLENDGTGAIQFDEDTAYSFTAQQTFQNGLTTTSGDIESGDTNGALEVDERASVADTGTVQLSRDAEALGYAMVQDVTNNESMMVWLAGSRQTVEIIHDSSAGDNFTQTEGNDGTTNVYYDSTNSRYELNNETGGTVTYAVEVLKG
jgi:hypothetical protein